jgi:hypothetical protein
MSTSCIEKIAWPEISIRLLAANWPELEALAPASRAGLSHNVRHKSREGFVEWNTSGVEFFAARTTKSDAVYCWKFMLRIRS